MRVHARSLRRSRGGASRSCRREGRGSVFDADARQVSILSVTAPLFPIVFELVKLAQSCVIVLVVSEGVAPSVVRLPVAA